MAWYDVIDFDFLVTVGDFEFTISRSWETWRAFVDDEYIGAFQLQGGHVILFSWEGEHLGTSQHEGDEFLLELKDNYDKRHKYE